MQNSACANFPGGSCAINLAQNQSPGGVQLNSTSQQVLVNVQTGFNTVPINQTLIIPQWSILSFSQALNNYGGPRVDTTGAATYSDYMIGFVNQTLSTYSLTPLNTSVNYRFYVRALVTELILSKLKPFVLFKLIILKH